jgi:ubiquinone/menaquinone biosynthesis C-methylase UbiE
MTKFVEDTYVKIAQAYADEFFEDTVDLPFIDMLVDVLPEQAKVLDLGCGPGQFSKYLAEKGFQVDAIDVSDEMLAIAKTKVVGISFKKMDMRSLKFAGGTFDGVLAAYSIIHIPTAELPDVLDEIKRVLKPQGKVLFIVQRGEADQIMDEPLAEGEKIFMNFFTIERLNDLLTEADFKILEQGNATQEIEDVLSSTIIYTLAQ